MIRRTSAGWAMTSMPPTSSVPACGFSSVATALTSVVLPAPFGPSKAVRRPDSATRLRPSRAFVSP
jgi:hypothetical protein